MNMDLQTAVAKIRDSKDPVGTVGELVSESGGFWSVTEAADPTKLFAIHLLGYQGVGIGASAAIKDWLLKADEAIAAGAN